MVKRKPSSSRSLERGPERTLSLRTSFPALSHQAPNLSSAVIIMTHPATLCRLCSDCLSKIVRKSVFWAGNGLAGAIPHLARRHAQDAPHVQSEVALMAEARFQGNLAYGE